MFRAITASSLIPSKRVDYALVILGVPMMAWVAVGFLAELVITVATGRGSYLSLLYAASIWIEAAAFMFLWVRMVKNITPDVSATTLGLAALVSVVRCVTMFLQNSACYLILGDSFNLLQASIIYSALQSVATLIQFYRIRSRMYGDDPVIEADSFNAKALVSVILILTYLSSYSFQCASRINGQSWVDISFAFVCCAGCLLMLPQVWLSSRLGEIKKESGIFVMMLVVSRIASGCFFSFILSRGFRAAAIVVLVQAMLVSDYAFHCIRGWFLGGYKPHRLSISF